MAAQQQELLEEKWEGKATASLKGVKAEQVWDLFLDDFCSFHKWLPTIDTCRQVEGINGKPGLIRYCASTPPPTPKPTSETLSSSEDVLWCHEKLIEIDPGVQTLSYEVLDNNLGIRSFVSTIEVLPTINNIPGEDDEFGCQIQWSFLADPMEGMMTYDGFSSYINFALQGMAENMVRALKSA